MGDMQYGILFKQRPQGLPSMIYFPFMSKIILCVELATLCSSKQAKTWDSSTKNPSGGQDSLFLKGGGGIDEGGGMILHSGGGGGHWDGGAIGKGGGW